jgi:hypothetical protein
VIARYYVITVHAPDEEKADEVIANRLGPDEDYGFDYTLEWAEQPVLPDDQDAPEHIHDHGDYSDVQ